MCMYTYNSKIKTYYIIFRWNGYTFKVFMFWYANIVLKEYFCF